MILFSLHLLGNPWYIADAVYNKNKDMQKISPEIKDIFSQYNLYQGIDDMRRGMYFREYTALSELI